MENDERETSIEEDQNSAETSNTEEDASTNLEEESQNIKTSNSTQSQTDVILVEALINTNMEKDKTLFLASIGISGFLISFLSDPKTLPLLKTLCGISLLCFTVVIIAIIVIFQLNGPYIKALLARKSPQIIQHWLGILDKVSMFFFIIGVLISIGMGIRIVSF